MTITKLTTANYDSEVMNCNMPVLIDFWATWCGPCKMLSPVIDEIANENSDVKVCKVNVDEEPELAAKFNVMSIPTVAVVKNGKVANTSVGVKPKQAIVSMVK